MSGRILTLLLLAVCACGPDEPSGEPQGQGRMLLERTGEQAERLARLPATGIWCEADTTLSIVGADEDWSLAIAIRLPWPADSARSLDVDSVHAVGRAAIAVRPLGDSVHLAQVGRRGRVTLGPGRVLAGSYEFTAGPDTATVSYAGRFDGVAVTGTCP